MAATRSSSNLPDNITVCKLCRNTYIDPRLLPCMHTFCLKCIEVYKTQGKFEDLMPCPSCKTSFALSGGGAAGLPSNQFISKLVHVQQLSSAQNDTSSCEVCQSSGGSIQRSTLNATTYCLDCQQKLCDECHQYHKHLKLTSAHKTVPIGSRLDIEDIRNQFPSARCGQHQAETLKLYCDDCKTTLCMLCYVEEQHNTHKCSDINKVSDTMRQQLVQDAATLVSGVQRCDALFRSVSQHQYSVDFQCAHAEEAINKASERVIAMVRQQRERLLEELTSARTDAQTITATVTGNITQTKAVIEDMRRYVVELTEKGSASDVATGAHSLALRVKELMIFDGVVADVQASQQISVQFSPSVVSSSSSPDQTELVGTILYTGKPVDVSPTAVIATGSSETSIEAIATLGNLLFVARSGVNHLEVCDTTSFKVKYNLILQENTPSSQAFAGISRPRIVFYSLAACPINMIVYVSDSGSNTIRSFDPKKTQLVGKPMMNLANSVCKSVWRVSSPAKLCVTDKGNVLATSNESLIEYRCDGSQLRKVDFRMANVCPNSIIQHPSGLVLMSSVVRIGSGRRDDGVLVSLILITTDGRVVTSYSNNIPNSQLKQTTLVLTKKGLIVLFAGYPLHFRMDKTNASLQEVQSSMNCLDNSRNSITDVRVVCLDELKNRLFVGQCSDNRSILVYDFGSF